MSKRRIPTSSIYVSAFLFALMTLLSPQSANGQTDDLNVYGFFQTQYTHQKEYFAEEEGGYSSFITPQLNVFFSKDIGSSFTAFVSTEFLNNFDSNEGWGTFRLGEAQPPEAVTAAEIVSKVSSTSAAIGYVSADAVTEAVKVIATIE